MTARGSAMVWALLGSSVLACGGGDNATLNQGDATTSDVATEAGGEATTGEAAADSASSEGGVDAPAMAEGGGGDSGVDGGAADADAAPYLGSMPAPVTMGLLRFANWSPDSPAVDVCIAPHGTVAFQGPLIAALASATQTDAGTTGLPFPLVSAYMLVRPGQYDVRVVVAGGGTCAVGVTHDATALPAVQLGAQMTFALLGEAAPVVSGAYKLRVSGFIDDTASLKGSVGIRVINAAPEFAHVDVGTGSLATVNFTPIFQGVPVGGVGLPVGARFLVDANGYAAADPLSNVFLSAHAKGVPADAVISTAPIFAAAGTVVTIAVTGGLAGGGATLVECVDNAAAAGAISECNVWGPPLTAGM